MEAGRPAATTRQRQRDDRREVSRQGPRARGVRMEGGVPAAAAAWEWGRCPGGGGGKDCGEVPWRQRVEEWRDLSVPPAVAWREMESRLSRRRRRRQRGMEYGVVVAE
jgi:hypothetical protein